MNRMLGPFLAGAAGGAVMAFAIVALARILVLDPSAMGTDRMRTQGQIDELQSRVERLELNSGEPDPHDAKRMGGPQPYP